MLSSGCKLSSAIRSNVFPSLSSPLVSEMPPTVISQPEVSPYLTMFIWRGDGSHSLLVRLHVASLSKVTVKTVVILQLVFSVLKYSYHDVFWGSLLLWSSFLTEEIWAIPRIKGLPKQTLLPKDASYLQSCMCHKSLKTTGTTSYTNQSKSSMLGYARGTGKHIVLKKWL